MSDILLGIDIGTGSTKGVLTTPDGEIVATASKAHAMSLPRPGWAEVDATTVWWGDLVEVARELGLERSLGAMLAGNAAEPMIALGQWDLAERTISRKISAAAMVTIAR